MSQLFVLVTLVLAGADVRRVPHLTDKEVFQRLPAFRQWMIDQRMIVSANQLIKDDQHCGSFNGERPNAAFSRMDSLKE